MPIMGLTPIAGRTLFFCLADIDRRPAIFESCPSRTGATASDQGSGAVAYADEAPTSLDNLSNGFVDQSTFQSDPAKFEQIEATFLNSSISRSILAIAASISS